MKNLRRIVFLSLASTLFFSSAALSAFADPPGRAVHLKYMSGAVSIQPGGVNDWVAAVANRPLTTSDRVWTDKEARAELSLGSASMRANAETSLTLTNISDDMVQVELDQGTLNLHIRHLFGGDTYEIDTPNQAFTILKAGDYRFDVDPNADTTSVIVWHGEGEANGQGPGVKLKSGHQATFSGGTSLQNQMASAPDPDGFDDWCRVRDDREDHAKSYQYVSADVVGADELDEYGTWRTAGAYGSVWVPAVAPGWAPYHDGHWVWVEPWGWTWVDAAPWGFAPCHYGRWVFTGGYWGWAPGPVIVARPVYAPALVAWVGGPHFGVGLSFGGGGGVGWFALGWGEPYVPSYHVSQTYFQQVNVTNTHITNITTVTNNYYVNNNNTTVVNNNIQNIHYANQNVTGAVTAVPTRTMTNSEPVAKAAVTVPPSEMKNASVVNAAAVVPAKTSILGAKAGVPTATPPASAMAARPVVSHATPPPKPVPFEAKQEALAKNPGRPLDAQTETQIRTNIAAQPPAHAMTQPTPAGKTGSGSMTQPATAGKPGMPVASTPADATPAAKNARPVPRPGAPQPPAGNASAMESKPAGPATPSTPANVAGRPVPRPSQAGGSTTPSSQAPVPNPNQPAAAAHPVPRPPQAGNSGNTANNAISKNNGQPAATNDAVKPAVQNSSPSTLRAPQNVSMPHNAQPQRPSAPAPPQHQAAPQHHASSPKPSKGEEKSEHKGEGR